MKKTFLFFILFLFASSQVRSQTNVTLNYQKLAAKDNTLTKLEAGANWL